MRVLIDTTYSLRTPFSGTAIYTERLCHALRRTAEVEVIEAANTRRRPPAGGGAGSVRNLLSDRHWVSRELPRRAKRDGAVLIHHPLPALGRFTSLPQAITVHDLAFERLPDRFDARFRRYAHRVHRAAARSAQVVICVSEATAADVLELWEVPAERIVVAPHGPGQEIPLAEHERGSGQHFLYVGDDEPRKNLDTLLEAHRIYRRAATNPLPLILAGSVDRSESRVLVERAPTPERLAELYARAVALVQPSLYEGFGLTALEAMAAGTPVIASSVAGLLEVCGNAAVYTDPVNAQSLAVTMSRIAADPELRRDLGERGRHRASEFSWAQSAHAHVKAYSQALGRLPS